MKEGSNTSEFIVSSFRSNNIASKKSSIICLHRRTDLAALRVQPRATYDGQNGKRRPKDEKAPTIHSQHWCFHADQRFSCPEVGMEVQTKAKVQGT